MVIALSFLIGLVAGLRAMLAPAAISWAAYLGLISVEGTWLAWLGYWLTPWLFTFAAAGELVTDKLSFTPSRKVPPQFITRLISGALCGSAIAVSDPGSAIGAVAGVLGAFVGTTGGAAVRGALARTFGRDLPAALCEDVVGIALAALVITQA
ncbi:DUF4126 domain-containing protein [Novosphingobium sp. BL-8A]|uniref:DUF4126 domain-containing protein n=1 Tax=Novosphingobium sp. BL-8A TaxID=3127639 RepID=UPI003757F9BA